jgi:hypothetical protein
MYAKSLFATAALAVLVSAKTDLEGCTSSETVAFGGASMIYWVPDTGEICSFLDCGGGRAPPKTTVPGCGNYVGTATYTPDYMPGWGADTTPTPSAADSSSAPEESQVSQTTGTVTEGLSQVTAAPTLPGVSMSISLNTGTGTGTGTATPSANGTATFSTGSPSQPSGSAAAVALGAKGQGVLAGGLAGMIAGLALL